MRFQRVYIYIGLHKAFDFKSCSRMLFVLKQNETFSVEAIERTQEVGIVSGIVSLLGAPQCL